MVLDLKSEIISVMKENKAYPISEILELVNNKLHKEYAYTTISTILKRLEEDKIVLKVKSSGKTRDRNLYILSNDAPDHEARDFLVQFAYRFGAKGIKHLSEIIDNDFNPNDIDKIKELLD